MNVLSLMIIVKKYYRKFTEIFTLSPSLKKIRNKQHDLHTKVSLKLGLIHP